MFIYKKIFDLKKYIVKFDKVYKSDDGFSYINYSTLLVIGDENGGIGWGKASDKNQINSLNKAFKKAKLNYKKYILYKDTIYHSVIGKCCNTKVFLAPGRLGSGLIAGGAVRTIMIAMGIRNIISKVYGSNNSCNIIQATINALSNIRTKFYFNKY